MATVEPQTFFLIRPPTAIKVVRIAFQVSSHLSLAGMDNAATA